MNTPATPSASQRRIRRASDSASVKLLTSTSTSMCASIPRIGGNVPLA